MLERILKLWGYSLSHFEESLLCPPRRRDALREKLNKGQCQRTKEPGDEFWKGGFRVFLRQIHLYLSCSLLLECLCLSFSRLLGRENEIKFPFKSLYHLLCSVAGVIVQGGNVGSTRQPWLGHSEKTMSVFW